MPRAYRNASITALFERTESDNTDFSALWVTLWVLCGQPGEAPT